MRCRLSAGISAVGFGDAEANVVGALKMLAAGTAVGAGVGAGAGPTLGAAAGATWRVASCQLGAEVHQVLIDTLNRHFFCESQGTIPETQPSRPGRRDAQAFDACAKACVAR